MLPGLAGEKVLEKIQGIPVIVVSAKAEIDHKVDLLLGGAADYVTKPFDIRELMARIAVQLRGSGGSKGRGILTFEEISVGVQGTIRSKPRNSGFFCYPHSAYVQYASIDLP